MTILGEQATSVLGGFHVGLLSWSNWNLEMLVFVEEGEPLNTDKNPESKARTQPESNPGYIGGRRALPPLTISAPPLADDNLYSPNLFA